MRSPDNRPQGQRGFSLIEVMTASMVLSIFIIGTGALWITADRRVNALVVRQKAIYVANAEMERLTALYDTTSFATGAPVLTTGYDGPSFLPTTRLIYPTATTPYSGGPASNFSTSTLASFQTGDPFQVYVSAQLVPALNRSYIWIDQAQGVMARVSWTVAGFAPAACTVGSDGCGCLAYSMVGSAQCQRLDLFLEYPYRFVSGAPAAAGNLQTVILSTIVGRHT